MRKIFVAQRNALILSLSHPPAEQPQIHEHRRQFCDPGHAIGGWPAICVTAVTDTSPIPSYVPFHGSGGLRR
jgi:hypothetical protein